MNTAENFIILQGHVYQHIKKNSTVGLFKPAKLKSSRYFLSTPRTFGCVKMSHFVPNNRHLREVLIFFFHLMKTAAEAHREFQKCYDATLSEIWFLRFKDGDFDVDDRPHEGRPKTFENAELEALLDEDPCHTQEELASALGVTCPAIYKRLHALGMIQKQGTWVLYYLKPWDVERRFFAYEQLLQWKKRKGSLHRIVINVINVVPQENL